MILSLGSLLALLLALVGPARAEPLQVCATVPDLASLAARVGGDHVDVFVFAKGSEDAHFVEPRPSFLKRLSRADVLVRVGMDLERGWLPVLTRGARNARILPGSAGDIDASRVIEPLGTPPPGTSRAAGDVHAYGNPHYLLDPLNGLRVARLLRDRLSERFPEGRAVFEAGFAALRSEIESSLVGSELAGRYPVDKLALLYEHGRLAAFLASQGEANLLGGWLGRMQPYFGSALVTDHGLWPYFARRFGVRIVGALEPKPGVPPTTRHLRELIDRMRSLGVSAILTSAYYDPRHSRFVAEQTGAQVVPMAHQVGARSNTDDYVKMIAYNVRVLVEALERSAPASTAPRVEGPR
ncbi:MAG: metal ABC transporter substrate-binding protein [Myxococcota bacterium]